MAVNKTLYPVLKDKKTEGEKQQYKRYGKEPVYMKEQQLQPYQQHRAEQSNKGSRLYCEFIGLTVFYTH